MTLIDAYGLVALLAEETAADEVEALLRGGDCRVAAVNLAEAIDVCQRHHGHSAGDVRTALEPLILAKTLAVAASDERDAWLTADLRAKHYDRKRCAVSIADCLLLAHSLSADEPVATADPALAAVARSEGATVIALPDRAGRRP